MSTDTVRVHGQTIRIRKAAPRRKAEMATLPHELVPTVADMLASATAPPQPVERPRATHDGESISPLGPIEVREVVTRRDRNQFVTFPWQIYAGDKNWAPPLLIDVKAFIDRRKHPFYRHGEATQFLARASGRVVGRVLVSDDPNYNAQHETNLGAFGMFECVDDQNVADSLLNAAAAWLRRRGRTEMMGPIDYSTNYPCGLLIDGFDTPQRVMMNHNPPYYARLLEMWRLTKAKDLYAWWFDDSCDMLHKWAKRAERFAERSNVTVRPVSAKDFSAEVARCHAAYNQAWEKSWGFVKMTDAEFYHLARELKKYAVPELILLAEVDGEPAGFCLTAARFQRGDPPARRTADDLRRPDRLWRACCATCGGSRRRGWPCWAWWKNFAAAAWRNCSSSSALQYGRDRMGYTGAELGWTLEDNDLINRTIEKVGGRRYKTYRLYHTSI